MSKTSVSIREFTKKLTKGAVLDAKMLRAMVRDNIHYDKELIRLIREKESQSYAYPTPPQQEVHKARRIDKYSASWSTSVFLESVFEDIGPERTREILLQKDSHGQNFLQFFLKEYAELYEANLQIKRFDSGVAYLEDAHRVRVTLQNKEYENSRTKF